MSLPAIASAMRASSYPNVANAGARFFEGAQALAASGVSDAVDAELKAILDEDGVQVFADGIATSEADAQEIFEERPQFLEQWGTVINRYLVDGAAGAAGTQELRLNITAKDIRDKGAVLAGQFVLGDVPAKGRITRALVFNENQALTGLGAATASLGTAGGGYADVLAAASIDGANEAVETAPVTPVLSYTADSEVAVEITGASNLDQLDAGIPDEQVVVSAVVEVTL